MQAYKPNDWRSFFWFHLSKSDILNSLWPWLTGMFIYTAAVAFFEMHFWNLSKNEHVKNITQMHTLLGFALSMLLVFRTNTAYDRWWEGRKLWGSLVNNSRNLAIKLSAMLTEPEHRSYFRQAIPNFAFALVNHLRLESTRLALDEAEHPEFAGILYQNHVPNQVSGLLFQKANQLCRDGIISPEQLIIMNPELQSFTDICGACERIKNTPIPYSYSSFIRRFIFIYVITLPWGFIPSQGYLAIPIVTFISFVLGSLELVAEEIEEPFGLDPNDLPIKKMSENIDKHVGEIFGI